MKPVNQGHNQPRKKSIINGSLSIIFILSILLDVQSIMLYRFSIIPGKYLFDVGCIGSLMGFSILLFIPDNLYSKALGYILAIVAGGSILVFGFLQINHTFLDIKENIHVFRIIKSGTISSNRKPCIRHFAEIDFNGMTKKLLFDCTDQNSLMTFSGVNINYSEGFFGFPVIRTQQLLK